jgi:hypothetical protein
MTDWTNQPAFVFNLCRDRALQITEDGAEVVRAINCGDVGHQNPTDILAGCCLCDRHGNSEGERQSLDKEQYAT